MPSVSAITDLVKRAAHDAGAVATLAIFLFGIVFARLFASGSLVGRPKPSSIGMTA